MREYNTEQRRKRYKKQAEKIKKLMKILKINGCAICGYDKCSAALDFHHVNPQDKKFPLKMNSLSYASKDVVSEVNKCILLCKNCHAEIHVKERENKV